MLNSDNPEILIVLKSIPRNPWIYIKMFPRVILKVYNDMSTASLSRADYITVSVPTG